MLECRYNRCTICAFASECKVYAENKKAKEIIKEWQKKVCKELSDGCCPSCEYCHYGEIKASTEQFLGDEK